MTVVTNTGISKTEIIEIKNSGLRCSKRRIMMFWKISKQVKKPNLSDNFQKQKDMLLNEKGTAKLLRHLSIKIQENMDHFLYIIKFCFLFLKPS